MIGRGASRRIVIAGALLATVGLVGCTASGKGAPGALSSPALGTTATTATTPPLVTDSATPSTTAASSSTAAATAASSTAPSGSATTSGPAVPNECTRSQLSIRAIRGSAFQGTEFAQIVFTNSSSGSCTMYGFPGVSLRRDGALLGTPATRSGDAPANVPLAPGARATADLTDAISCNADLSDTVRVYPPDSTEFLDLPLVLRGCALTIKPVVAG